MSSTPTARRIHHVGGARHTRFPNQRFPAVVGQHLVSDHDQRDCYCYQAVELSTPGIAMLQDVDDLVRRRLQTRTPIQSLLDGLLEAVDAGTAFCFLVLGWQAGSADDNAARLLRAVTEWCRMRLAAELGTSEWQGKVRVIFDHRTRSGPDRRTDEHGRRPDRGT